jgi:hypothetical protein
MNRVYVRKAICVIGSGLWTRTWSLQSPIMVISTLHGGMLIGNENGLWNKEHSRRRYELTR